MHTKTMEGLAGARTNIKLLNTPMRVYNEAKRRGDTATMERAMGYVGDFLKKANEYQAKADEGMKEEAIEAREKEKSEREKAIEKLKEETERLENIIEESKNTKADTMEVSEEGKLLLKDAGISDETAARKETLKPDAVKEPVTYTKTGSVNKPVHGGNISVFV